MIKTVKLTNGREVLAKTYKDQLCAVTYTNRTQANKKQAELGNEWAVYRFYGRAFYVGRVVASWVLRNKETKQVICETFDPRKVEALNTAKYEAVEIQKYLAELLADAVKRGGA